MDRRVDRQIGELIDKYEKDKWIGKQIDRQEIRQIDRRVDRQIGE